MRLTLLSSDGYVLDQTDDFTREEWDAMTPLGKGLLVDDLMPGKDAR